MKFKSSAHSLAPGLYRLKQDVKNPRGDKRQKYSFWKLYTWKSGTVFMVRDNHPVVDIPGHFIGPAGRFESILFSAKNDDILDVLVPNLEPEKHSIKSVLLSAREHEHRVNPEDILEQLILDKTVSLTDVEKATEAVRKREREQSQQKGKS